MKTKYYKILVDGKSCNGGDLTWSLPKQDKKGKWTPGKWHKIDDDIVMCSSGIHLTTKPYQWYKWNCICYEAEPILDGAIHQDDKSVFVGARLLKPVQHPKWWLDAIDFVDSIKHVQFLKPDGKPLKSWKLFTGKTWYAARYDARNAACDAASNAARYAASNAARNAACDAASNAARYDARNAACDAAGNAASNAACDAARYDAWNAAWDAAWNDARYAAWDAANYVACNCICHGLKLNRKHIKYSKAAWQVWQKGYALFGCVNGVIYVYAKTE